MLVELELEGHELESEVMGSASESHHHLNYRLKPIDVDSKKLARGKNQPKSLQEHAHIMNMHNGLDMILKSYLAYSF